MKGRPTLNIEADVHRQLQNADWENLGKKLLHYAIGRASYYSWRNGGPFELAVGQSVEDIVQKVIYQTCAGKRKWDPAKGPLDMWLKDQVKSVMDRLAESAPHRHETDSLDLVRGDGSEDGADGSALEYAPPESARVASTEEVVLRQEEIQKEFDLLFDATDGDEQLEQMIEAVLAGHEKSAEIAEAMGIPVKEVYNLTRKLKRRVARKREQYGSPQRG